MNTTITLDTPIKQGETEITTVTLRRPHAGELRGLSVSDLLQMDVSANIKLLPRISELAEHQVAALDPADLTQLASAVAGFFLPKSALG